MKRLVLSALFVLFVTPCLSIARDHDSDRSHHHRISGTDIAGVGFAAAGVIGVVGYLVLRGRQAK